MVPGEGGQAPLARAIRGRVVVSMRVLTVGQVCPQFERSCEETGKTIILDWRRAVAPAYVRAGPDHGTAERGTTPDHDGSIGILRRHGAKPAIVAMAHHLEQSRRNRRNRDAGQPRRRADSGIGLGDRRRACGCLGAPIRLHALADLRQRRGLRHFSNIRIQCLQGREQPIRPLSLSQKSTAESLRGSSADASIL